MGLDNLLSSTALTALCSSYGGHLAEYQFFHGLLYSIDHGKVPTYSAEQVLRGPMACLAGAEPLLLTTGDGISSYFEIIFQSPVFFYYFLNCCILGHRDNTLEGGSPCMVRDFLYLHTHVYCILCFQVHVSSFQLF